MNNIETRTRNGKGYLRYFEKKWMACSGQDLALQYQWFTLDPDTGLQICILYWLFPWNPIIVIQARPSLGVLNNFPLL